MAADPTVPLEFSEAGRDYDWAARRAAQLQEVTAALSEAVTAEEVGRVVVEQGLAVLGADAGFLTSLSPGGEDLEVLAAAGYAPDYVERYRRFPLASKYPIADCARSGEPVLLDSPEARQARYPELAQREQGSAYGAWAALPMVAQGRVVGALGLSFAEPHRFTTEDLFFALSIARQAGQALERARLFEAERSARANAEAAEQRLQFLMESSRLLVTSLDYETTLRSLARLTVPALADWCLILVVDRDGVVGRIESAGSTAAIRDTLAQLLERYPPDLDHDSPLGRVLRAGEAVVVPAIPATFWQRLARDQENLVLLQDLGTRSLLYVPLVARGRRLGAIALGSTNPGRAYTASDLKLTQELGRYAAFAVDNARLYRESADANKAKLNFLATISHEFRTPLSSVVGYVDILSTEVAGPLTERQKEQLGRIRTSAWHLVALIEEIRSFTRMEAGKEMVRPAPVEVCEESRQAAALVEPAAQEKGIQFVVSVPGEPVTIETDAAKLRQILLNLLSNAVKFTDAGQVSLTLRATRGEVIFRVRDTGIGIAPEHREKVFEPFWQVDQAGIRSVGGTGLGLSVSRGLARLLGGDLTVQSQLGEGSVFSLRLPRSLPEPSS